jgi:uncharacterized membrane protein YidH (DUF202 family)
MKPVKPEKCANCGRQIGELETPQIWRDNVVCSLCRIQLEAGAAPQASPPTPAVATAPRRDWRLRLGIYGGGLVAAAGAGTFDHWFGPIFFAVGLVAFVASAVVAAKNTNYGAAAQVAILGIFCIVSGFTLASMALSTRQSWRHLPAFGAPLASVGFLLLIGSLILVFIRWVTREAVREARKS